MSLLLTIHDETVGGKKSQSTMDLASRQITVRDLIAERVRQRLAEEDSQGRQLVEPTALQKSLNAVPKNKASGEQAFAGRVANLCHAFEAGTLIVLVGENQLEDLDEELGFREGDDEVTFLKLVPLVGG